VLVKRSALFQTLLISGSGPLLFVQHSDVVVDVTHARHAVDDIRDEALRIPRAQSSAQRDFAIFDCNVDFRRIDAVVLRQHLADIFEDALILAIRARASASMIASTCLAGVAIDVDGSRRISTRRVRVTILRRIASISTVFGLREVVIEAVMICPPILERHTAALLSFELAPEATMLIACGIAVPTQVLPITIQIIA
jgi:hypothetical protein